jgi:hypothetical protein
VWHELWWHFCEIYVKFQIVFIVNRSSLKMPDAAAAQRAITAIRIKKNNFTKSSFVTLLLVSQRLTYDAKVEKFIFLVIILR